MKPKENVMSAAEEYFDKHHTPRRCYIMGKIGSVVQEIHVIELMEAYHKYRVESITDEMIEEQSQDYSNRAYFGHFSSEEPEYHYSNGMMQFKQELLKLL